MAAHSAHVKLLVFAAALGCLLGIAHFSPAVHANGLNGGDAAATTADDSGQPIVVTSSSSPSADVSLPSPEHLPSLFLAWLERHPRAYHAVEAPARHMEEKLHRFAIFADNVRHIFEHNKHRHGSGKASYWLDLNEFADLTHEEFKQKYLQSSSGKQLMRRTEYLAQPTVTHIASDAGQCLSSAAVANDIDSMNSGCTYGAGNDVGIAIPTSVDWRERGAVTPVKNQGQCGSCWAFSTVVAVEGAHQIATGELVSLSEQELVDCDTDTNSGCNGGAMPAAFEFLVSNGGIDTEEDYPYKARKGACVASKRDNRMVTIDSYEEVPINDEEALLRAVASQPVSVGIDASTRDFQFYAGGVYDGNCGTDLDHGVAIVGYGTTDDDSRQDYWIVKNSWGPNWGDDGFILMKRGTLQPEGKCGINTMASFPIKKDTEAHKSRQSHHRHKQH